MTQWISLQGTSVCQATVIGAVVILLYTSRACYNLVVVSLSPQDKPSPFSYGWYSVSDQVLFQVALVLNRNRALVVINRVGACMQPFLGDLEEQCLAG